METSFMESDTRLGNMASQFYAAFILPVNIFLPMPARHGIFVFTGKRSNLRLCRCPKLRRLFL